MMKSILTVLVTWVLGSMAATAWASGAATAGPGEPARVLAPASAPWAGAMVLIIAGLFLAAALVGVAVRATAGAEPAPDAHDAHADHDDHGHAAH